MFQADASAAYISVKKKRSCTQGAVNTNGSAISAAKNDRGAGDPADANAAQIEPRTRAPKSPCGRTTSIAISTTKKVKLDQVGEIWPRRPTRRRP